MDGLAGRPLADIEKQVILSTLQQFKGHRVRTASALGIGVRTLGMKPEAAGVMKGSRLKRRRRAYERTELRLPYAEVARFARNRVSREICPDFRSFGTWFDLW